MASCRQLSGSSAIHSSPNISNSLDGAGAAVLLDEMARGNGMIEVSLLTHLSSRRRTQGRSDAQRRTAMAKKIEISRDLGPGCGRGNQAATLYFVAELLTSFSALSNPKPARRSADMYLGPPERDMSSKERR